LDYVSPREKLAAPSIEYDLLFIETAHELVAALAYFPTGLILE
jgi:hypothetical protein